MRLAERLDEVARLELAAAEAAVVDRLAVQERRPADGVELGELARDEHVAQRRDRVVATARGTASMLMT